MTCGPIRWRRSGVLASFPTTPVCSIVSPGRELIQFVGELRGMDQELVAERREALLRLLDLVEAADVIVADYSLGMTKKIAIAVALLHDPAVLFLDEPFAGVDPVARQSLERILRRHTESGGTVVFSDHAMDLVERLCDHIMLIDHGQRESQWTGGGDHRRAAAPGRVRRDGRSPHHR